MNLKTLQHRYYIIPPVPPKPKPVPGPERWCPDCKVTQPADQFQDSGSERCRTCMKEWRATRREARRESSRKWKREHKNAVNDYARWWRAQRKLAKLVFG